MALSVMSGEQAQGVANHLQARKDQGFLEYETGYIEKGSPSGN
jgi:transcriptional antiterminator Rof (Rho-off)